MSVVEQGLEEFNTFIPACLAVAQSCCFGRGAEPSSDGSFRCGCDYGISCHSEALAEESQCLVANASNFALTPPQWGRLGWGTARKGGAIC